MTDTPWQEEKTTDPLAGIWWQVEGSVVHFGEDPELMEAVEGIRDMNVDHVRMWPVVGVYYPAVRKLQYDEVPRGRVILRKGQFAILAGPKQVTDTSLIAQIIETFNLPQDKVTVEVDEHYVTGRPGLYRALLDDDDDPWGERDDNEY
jgi:hypothetical protein